ncbi:hypothetical protein [Falsiroseomonas sp.]|uniref:hypothetical protein n=1 Tax=Falsiroseomonas sp. TaxID=2870721 RepID=UPI0035615DAE
MAAARPKHQRWIKRPPRPSRTGQPAAPPRRKPGMTQFLLAIGGGVGVGLLGAMLGPMLAPGQEGMGGLLAGLGLALGFMVIWRAFGGTRQDIRDLFR